MFISLFHRWKKPLGSETLSNSPKGTGLTELGFKPRQPCSLPLCQAGMCPFCRQGHCGSTDSITCPRTHPEQEPRIQIQLCRSQSSRAEAWHLPSETQAAVCLESSVSAPGRACAVPVTALLKMEGSWRGSKEGARKMVCGMWRTRLKGMAAMTVQRGNGLVNKPMILEQRGWSLNKEIRKKIKLSWGNSDIALIKDSVND